MVDILDVDLSHLGVTKYGKFSVEVVDPVSDYLELMESHVLMQNPPLYAKDLVNILYKENGPDFGAASDGDGDRNKILGREFFGTHSDSVAIIPANAQNAIPFFQSGPKGLAKFMPTSGALDRVAEKLNLPFFEVWCSEMLSKRLMVVSAENWLDFFSFLLLPCPHWLEILYKFNGCQSVVNLW
ncbi:phosphoglucomutase, chloroplastic-like [Apium graveolens]|uniref:phosphoglucomutase, chloroplastic-like n=1 Tax=Apium graveolens TaxID=4045 RepID=UPI003D7A8CC9